MKIKPRNLIFALFMGVSLTSNLGCPNSPTNDDGSASDTDTDAPATEPTPNPTAPTGNGEEPSTSNPGTTDELDTSDSNTPTTTASEPGTTDSGTSATGVDSSGDQTTGILPDPLEKCGNGQVENGLDPETGVEYNEDCDDGNEDNTDACTNVCKYPICGDGFVQPGDYDQCRDGNDDNTDGCTNGCQLAKCGDGHIWAGVESCDDGNTLDGDECPSICRPHSCGDGVKGPDEGCDPGQYKHCVKGVRTDENGVPLDPLTLCLDDEANPDMETCSTECEVIKEA